jgi:hypothetical protein
MRCGRSGEWRRKRGHGDPVCKSIIRNAAAIASIHRLDAERSKGEFRCGVLPSHRGDRFVGGPIEAGRAERLFGLKGEIKAAVQAKWAHAVHAATF